MKKIFYGSMVFLFVFLISLRAFAANGPDNWVGSTSANFNDSNWSGANNPPISGDSWIFDGAGTSGTALNNNLASLISVAGITFNSDADPFTINGNSITLTGDIANNSNSNETLGIDVAGTITNSGTGSGSTTISGGVDSSVTAITENSSTSALNISINPITVNSSGTTLTDTNGSVTVSGGVTGTGNLVIDNNTSTNNAVTLSTESIGNTGTITNSGTGPGSTMISANIASSVTNVIENSSTSALVLSGINTYSGATTITAGTLQLGSSQAIPTASDVSIGGSGILDLNGNSATMGSLAGSGIVTSSTAGVITLTAGGDGSPTTFSGDIQNGSSILSFTKSGSGTMILSGDNTYSGTTSISAGTLQLGSSQAIPIASDVNISGTLDLQGNSATMGSLAGSGIVTSSAAGSVILNAGGDGSSTTFSGHIQDGSGSVELEKQGSGVLTVSGINNYSGGTIISAGTLQAENANALGTGAVVNSAALDIGTTNLSIGGAYTQNTGSTLDLAANSSSSFGKITSTVAAAVAAGSSINVTVEGYIPNNAVLEIINTNGTGITGSSPSTVTSTNSFIHFSSSVSGGNLILTADNSGFASVAGNPNARAAGIVLDNVTNPSSDMTNALNALENAGASKAAAALNTVGPVVDGGVVATSATALNNLISATLDRIEDSITSTESGISTGDDSQKNGMWVKPYGSYLSQGTRQGIQGYDAWNVGAVVGADRLMTDDLTVGLSLAYAGGQADSDISDDLTTINSVQGSIYAGYAAPDINYFINAIGTLGWNWYDGQRDINIDTINRTANASYDGQQYGAYVEGGYKIKMGDAFQIAPLASLQWTHLSLSSYTENNAGALDLNVKSQNYDILESGLGASLSSQATYEWGILTPEIHAKFLYDLVDDTMSVTSSLTGGGGSFTYNGATPAKAGANLGGKLSFDMISGISLIADFETEIRDEFFGIYGSGTVRVKF